jgi:hypothetical protein
MLDGAIIIPLQSLFWNLIFEGAALLWVVGRALLNVGYFIMVLTGWMSQNIFAPLLDVVNNQTGLLVGPLFVIAMTILGFTYMLSVFGRFEVVRMRSAVMWLLFAAAMYSFGPGIYLGMEDFRRLQAVVSMKQVSPLSTMRAQRRAWARLAPYRRMSLPRLATNSACSCRVCLVHRQ